MNSKLEGGAVLLREDFKMFHFRAGPVTAVPPQTERREIRVPRTNSLV